MCIQIMPTKLSLERGGKRGTRERGGQERGRRGRGDRGRERGGETRGKGKRGGGRDKIKRGEGNPLHFTICIQIMPNLSPYTD